MGIKVEIEDAELKSVVTEAVRSQVLRAMKEANWDLDEDVKRYIGRRFSEGDWQRSVDWAIAEGLKDAVLQAFEESGIQARVKAEALSYLDSEEFAQLALQKMKQVAIDSTK